MPYEILQQKCVEFSVSIVEISRKSSTPTEWELIRQLLRSSTSIGANLQEALGAYSKNDFLHKATIAYKEARESKYWIGILYKTGYLEQSTYEHISPLVEELCKMLYKIIKNTKCRTSGYFH